MNFGSCRFCGSALTTLFCDLGMSPLANAYILPKESDLMESFYPLRVYVCGTCFLVQVHAFESPEFIFGDYPYCSSYSDSWLEHSRAFADYARERFGLGPKSLVVEVASNDGYLLKYFQRANIPVMGIEPAANIAKIAESSGIPTLVKFFGLQTAQALVKEGKQADLLIGNNVLAHVPDLNDFVGGMRALLAPGGVLTMEFPHLLRMIQHNQFDTIYHEHFSYLSFTTVQHIFNKHGLELFDVQELSTHGGSLRIFAKQKGAPGLLIQESVRTLLNTEMRAGIQDITTYMHFYDRVKKTKFELLELLIKAKREGHSIVGYGAPAKGNTLLNYCGIGTEFVDYTVDKNPQKQGCSLPGTRIPVYDPEKLQETKPDIILILPWNILEEIVQQLQYTREWGAKLFVAIPSPKQVG